MGRLRAGSRVVVAGAAAGAVALAASHITSVRAGGETNTALDGFTTAVELPASASLGEPTIVSDASGNLYVTAPQGIGNINTAGASPLYRSTNGGATWQAPGALTALHRTLRR